jgi:tetratricopeptide (TPR) repeat protein
VLRRARASLAVLGCISLLAVDQGARAEEPTKPADQAERAYRRALALYDDGELEAALGEMSESYRLSQRAELLYNIARIEDELGRCQPSLATYREYLDRVPDGRYRDLARQSMERLTTQCAEPERTTVALPATSSTTSSPAITPPKPILQQPAAATVDSPPRWTTQRWLGLSAIGAGALAGVGAIYFTSAAADARDRFQQNVDDRVAGRAPLNRGLQDEQHRDQRWAQALAVTGGALVAGGVLLVLLAPRPSSPATTVATLDVRAGVVTTSLTHSF